MKPKIALIVPIYNTERYLRECLTSIITQTYKNIEIILVDDHSTDSSMEIAAEFSQKDRRIKIITREQNGGLSAARNTGLKNSAAPFVMFVDSDDFIAPAFCQKLLEALEQSGADLAVCGMDFIYETDRHMADSDNNYYKIKFKGLQTVSDRLLRNTDVSSCNKIHCRAILEKHGIEFPAGLLYEDAYFYNAYACWAKTVFFVPEKLYTYRRRAGSTMNKTFGKKSRRSIDHLKIAILFYEYLKKHNLWPKRKNYMGEVFFSYLMFAISNELTRRGRADIYKLAMDFVRRERWQADMFPPNLRQKFQILEPTLLGKMRRSNFLMGLLMKLRNSKDFLQMCRHWIFTLHIPGFRNRHRFNIIIFGLQIGYERDTACWATINLKDIKKKRKLADVRKKLRGGGK